jgi:Kef-type K+ transport system membrane component KefB
LIAGLIAASGSAPHHDPVAGLALALVLVLLAAKLGGDLAVRIRQPAVLGELVAGVVLGNLALVGLHAFETLKSDSHLDMLARLGVLVLLFEVGLESTVGEMLRVGWAALRVAVLGVLAPFALGWAVGAWLLPDHGPYVHAFLGATLCATSVGITARVLKDLGREKSAEARIILGAAVIDDVLGLIVLAAVTGLIAAADAGGNLPMAGIVLIIAKAVAFLFGALVLGVYFAPKLLLLASRMRARGVLLAVGLSLCFLLSWLADRIGLAPLVGAFAAGLVLENVHYRDFVDRGEPGLEHLLQPLALFLVPVFFVLMGMRVDLRSFVEPGVPALAAALTAAAILGKQACALGVARKEADRLAVGIGMIPRGEVGLIFAGIGFALTLNGQPVIDRATFAAIVVMVVFTTMATPPLLSWRLRERNGDEKPRVRP